MKNFNIKKNSLIVLILTMIVLFFILKDNLPEVIEDLKNTNILIIIGVLGIYFLSYFFDTLSYYYVVKQYKEDYTLKKAMRLNILTHFFNGITPLASGGQPMQLYALHKDKVKYSDASTCVIQFYVIYQIGLMIISTIALLYGLILHYMVANSFAIHMYVIGFIINIAILLFLIFVSFNKKFNKAVVRFIIKVLHKFKIVKNKEKTIEKWDKNCEGFYESAQLMKENKLTLYRGIFLQVLQIICRFSVPLFVVYAIGASNSLNIFSTIAISSFVTICSCYVPIPGATGGVEYCFGTYFKNFIATDGIRATLIIWRFITYFLPVIIGGIIFNIKEKE